MAAGETTTSTVGEHTGQDSDHGNSFHSLRRTRGHPVPVKDRLFTSLYRLRYGWSFSGSVQIGFSPVWILGACYCPDKDVQDSEGAPPHVLMSMDHFYSLPWITYRSGFPAIEGTGFTTDCGWGCMVRSGQMLLATALHCHFLGRDWRLSSSDAHGHTVHRQILSWFGDSPKQLYPFSLHRLMEAAVVMGHHPGDWFGPSQVAVLLRECVRRALREHINLQKLNVYVAYDCTVYIGDVTDIFTSDPDQSLLVLIPVRLGSEALNSIYIPCVKALLSLDNTVGIIGGRPKHSVYFVGFQDDHLLHLDPHYSQAAVNMSLPDFGISSYHCRTPKKLLVSKMDPSCTLGFYCHNQEDFGTFVHKAQKVLAPPMQKGQYPFFSFCDKRLKEMISPEVTTTEESVHSQMDIDGRRDSDGFVVLDCELPAQEPS